MAHQKLVLNLLLVLLVGLAGALSPHAGRTSGSVVAQLSATAPMPAGMSRSDCPLCPCCAARAASKSASVNASFTPSVATPTTGRHRIQLKPGQFPANCRTQLASPCSCQLYGNSPALIAAGSGETVPSGHADCVLEPAGLNQFASCFHADSTAIVDQTWTYPGVGFGAPPPNRAPPLA